MSAAKAVLKRAIEARAFPGCAVAVGDVDAILWLRGFGHIDYSKTSPVNEHTLYDLASLTKVVGTTAVVMTLVRDGRLALNDQVVQHVPEFGRNASRRRVTIEHLLTHSSGLPAGRPFYLTKRGFEAVLSTAFTTPLEAAPGTRARYSDIGFMILGEVAARAGRQRQEHLERTLVFKPLGMQETLRNPSVALRERTAPTEEISTSTATVAPRSRGTSPNQQTPTFVHGVVHDENARAADGLTGHAGLFSTATDLSLFARETLRALSGRSSVFPKQLMQLFVVRRQVIKDSSRGLGWDTPSGHSSAGDLFSRKSFGHTGFTGTSMWIDPERGIYLVLLTNRVHPSRANRQISQVRRDLADAVVRDLEKASASDARR
ncbi:MAG: beta-lactamase family protein [Planctomycetes bacterium]|nr:beta-lactamase family protein [Planctomycetota bacterium]